MRRGRDNGVLQTESGSLVGINLGADYCAEHEWGIEGLREMFGIPDTGYGLTKRTITRLPIERDYLSKQDINCVHLHEFKDETILVCSRYWDTDLKNETPKQREEFLARFELYRGYGDKSGAIATAWDEKSFGIRAFTALDREALRAVYEAMQRNDLAIWLGGGGVFQNAGLVLAIASRVPKDKAQQLHDADVDYENLQKASQATGIAAKLEKAGKRYYALSPRWVNEQQMRAETKHKVHYWLNPCDQHMVNYGWFTVEQLEQWIEGKGPIPMTQDEIKKRARR